VPRFGGKKAAIRPVAKTLHKHFSGEITETTGRVKKDERFSRRCSETVARMAQSGSARPDFLYEETAKAQYVSAVCCHIVRCTGANLQLRKGGLSGYRWRKTVGGGSFPIRVNRLDWTSRA
jgi:hypothetical protein